MTYLAQLKQEAQRAFEVWYHAPASEGSHKLWLTFFATCEKTAKEKTRRALVRQRRTQSVTSSAMGMSRHTAEKAATVVKAIDVAEATGDVLDKCDKEFKALQRAWQMASGLVKEKFMEWANLKSKGTKPK